jgi:hypothetical protein
MIFASCISMYKCYTSDQISLDLFAINIPPVPRGIVRVKRDFQPCDFGRTDDQIFSAVSKGCFVK